MTLALLRKELKEHGWVLGALYALQAISVIGAATRAAEEGGQLTTLRTFTISMGVVGVLVVANRLVVREYSGRTQLFLETLPVTRLRVLIVKLFLGATLCLVPVALTLAFAAFRARHTEPITPRYLAIAGSRALVATAALYGFAFMAGILGRYRLGLWLFVVFAAFTLDQQAKVQILELPLMRLVRSDLPFERQNVPWSDLLGAAGAGLGFIALAFGLALYREGSIATFLARRMTHREKAFFVGLGIAYLVLWGMIESHARRPPFELLAAQRAAAGESTVGVATGQGLSAAAAQQTGQRIAGELDGLREFLGLTQVPPLFILPNHQLDADVFLRAELPSADGVVIEAALADPTIDRHRLDAFALGHVLSWYTRGRATLEPVAWLADGLALWWVERGDPEARQLELLRAAAALPKGLPEGALRRWYAVSEELGDCASDAVSERLIEAIGEAQLRTVAKRVLGHRPPDDVRAPLSDAHLDAAWLSSVERDFDRSLGEARGGLAPLPEREAQLEWHPLPGGRAVELRHRLPGDYAVRFARLDPWTGPLARSSMARYDAHDEGVLPLTLPPGTRVFTAIEVQEPALKCERRLAARRWVAP